MSEMEKLTVNLTPVDLGRIELLVEQGFYSNRAEFIRSSIQAQLEKHTETITDVAKRESLVLGALTLNRRALERYKKEGKKARLNVVGFLSLADDVTPELAREAVESIRVHGIFRAPANVKIAIAERINE